MQIPDLNSAMTTTNTPSKNNFLNLVILDENGKPWASLGFLKDKNTEAKTSDATKLFSMVGYSLSLEAPEREYNRMTFPSAKK